MRVNLLMEIFAIVIIPTLWYFYRNDIIPFTTVFFLLVAIAMIASDYFKVWKSLKI